VNFLRRLVTAATDIVTYGMPVCVCKRCVRPTDKIVGPAGDFSVCERCSKSITSRDGVSVHVLGSRR